MTLGRGDALREILHDYEEKRTRVPSRTKEFPLGGDLRPDELAEVQPRLRREMYERLARKAAS